jgi:putative phosphoribosyl transferase
MIFQDRREAGKKLAGEIERLHLELTDPIVLGIPRGGVEVGFPVASSLECPLEVISLRKLPIPGNEEMGFGAVTLGKNVVLNQELIDAGFVDPGAIDGIVEEVYREVLRRDRLYRGLRPFPKLAGRSVLVVDDGLATGYTMLAAAKFVSAEKAGRVIAACPVAHSQALKLIRPEVDEIVCLDDDANLAFAVVSFYGRFPDLGDGEVIRLLEESRRPGKPFPGPGCRGKI